MLSHKHSLNSEIYMLKSTDILNFSSSVGACFRPKICLWERGSVSNPLPHKKPSDLKQQSLFVHKSVDQQSGWGSVMWFFYWSKLNSFVTHSCVSGQLAVSNLTYISGHWLAIGWTTGIHIIFLIPQQTGLGSFTGWWSQAFQNQ